MWTDGVMIYNGNNALLLTSYDGATGEYMSTPYSVAYKPCLVEFRDCPMNMQGVHEDDVTPYKKGNYFDMFLSAYRVLHVPSKEFSREATIYTGDTMSYPTETITSDVYDTLMQLSFVNLEEASFNKQVVVKSNGNRLVVRQDSIVIPGILAVGFGTRSCTQQVDINGVTAMMYSAKGYNFYQYGDILIKISSTYNVGDYITLQ